MTIRAQSSPRVAWIDGRLVAWADAAVPLEDRGLQFGESLYEVLPVTRGTPRLIGEHARRLRRGAVELGLEGAAPDEERIAMLASMLLAEEAFSEGLLYLQLTGGCAARDHAPTAAPRPTLLAYARAHRFPRAEDAARGQRAITLPDTRWSRCDIKTTMLLPAVIGRRRARRSGAHEAILVGPDGYVHEGTSSNVFVVESGRFVSPPPSHEVLPGVTAGLAERLLQKAGHRVLREPIPLERLAQADEALLTSTTRLAQGLVALDDRPLRPGGSGPCSLELAALLRRELEID